MTEEQTEKVDVTAGEAEGSTEEVGEVLVASESNEVDDAEDEESDPQVTDAVPSVEEPPVPPPATVPGVQHVKKDERIAAKMKNAPPAASQAAAVAGGGAVGAVAVASTDARIQAKVTGAAAPATTPGAKPAVDIDRRIQEKVGGAEKPSKPQGKNVDVDKKDEEQDSKPVLVTSRQEVSAGKDIPALEITEEVIDHPSTDQFEKIEDGFVDGSGFKAEDNSKQIESGIKTEDDFEDNESYTGDDPDAYGEDSGLAVAVPIDPESDDEFIPPAVQIDPDEKGRKPKLKDRRVRNFGIAFLCVIICLAIGLSVGLTQTLRPNNLVVDDVITMTPSAAPTTDVFLGIAEFLEEELLLNDIESTLQDANSPHAQALDWVVNVDTFLGLGAENTNRGRLLQDIDMGRLLQRFVLAVFAFSTNSLFWNDCGFPTDNTGLCIVEFDDVNVTFSSWLSPLDECGWFGVLCTEDDTVQQIFVDINNITGPFPAEFSLLVDLALLDLPGNRLTGPFPPQIKNFRALEELRVTNNEMTGEIPDELYDLSSLVSLTLGGNGFSGTLSTKIGQLTSLNGLFIFFNNFDGPIPSEIGELRFLGQLLIQDTPFTGTMPSEIGSLTKLTVLQNSNTLMTGEIPNEIGNLENLEILDIFSSRYSGPLPPNFYNLERLFDFFAFDIKSETEPVTPGLTGTISPDIGKMQNLFGWFVFGNSLEGEVPDEFASLPNLENVVLSFNNFNGTAPFCNPDIPTLTIGGDFMLEMDCLDSASQPALVECPCCDVCCDIDGLCLDNQP